MSSHRVPIWSLPTTAASVFALAVLALSSCSSSTSTSDETGRNEDGTVVEGGEDVEALTAVPCSEAHTGEVISVDENFYGDLDEFPGEDAAFTSADAPCVAALDAYTATSYESSPFDYSALVPTSVSWDVLDDRELVCVGLTLGDDLETIETTTGSMRAG